MGHEAPTGQEIGTQFLLLAISGLIFMTFMKIHVLQFRLGDTDQFGPHLIKPPKVLTNFQGIPTSESCRHLGRDAGCVLTYR